MFSLFFTIISSRIIFKLFPYTTLFRSQKIKEAPGKKVVAVLGAAHVPGIKQEIKRDHDLAQLDKKPDRKSTRLNSSHVAISYAVFCLKNKKSKEVNECTQRHQTE